MPPQGSLYFGRCNVNDLHRAVVASSSDGVTIWVKMDDVDRATDVQGAQNFLPRLCADKVYAPITTTRR